MKVKIQEAHQDIMKEVAKNQQVTKDIITHTSNETNLYIKEMHEF